MTTADFLIVGQGVAGSVLGWTLDQLGYKVIIANAPQLPAAANVAAGIVNPLTGRKLVKTWRADELFPFLHVFYTSIEQKLGVQFFHPRSIYRPFRSVDERNSYLALTSDPGISNYINQSVDDECYTDFIHNPYGGLEVTQGGWVDLPEFLKIIKGYFLKKGQYADYQVDPRLLTIHTDSVTIDDLSVGKVIFCDGTQSRENPLFDWLPYNPVKGQILTALVERYPIKNIVNQGVFILPVREGLIKIGATYSWHDLDWQTTEDGREFLEKKVREFLKVPYQIVDQRAGIRPSTKDRRPFIGIHPVYSTIGIFGGLGTKGVSLAPYLAQQYAGFLLNNEELDAETNINRCLSLYLGT